MATASSMNTVTPISKQQSDLMRFLDACLILSELVGVDVHTIEKKYKCVGHTGLVGTIIAEIRLRRHRGDNLRKEIRLLKKKVEELSQPSFEFESFLGE